MRVLFFGVGCRGQLSSRQWSHAHTSRRFRSRQQQRIVVVVPTHRFTLLQARGNVVHLQAEIGELILLILKVGGQLGTQLAQVIRDGRDCFLHVIFGSFHHLFDGCIIGCFLVLVSAVRDHLIEVVVLQVGQKQLNPFIRGRLHSRQPRPKARATS